MSGEVVLGGGMKVEEEKKDRWRERWMEEGDE